jgi:hypothetical protein
MFNLGLTVFRQYLAPSYLMSITMLEPIWLETAPFLYHSTVTSHTVRL